MKAAEGHGRHDAQVQCTQAELASEWSGNQRVLHFGPLAQRDPFFYYYPKGWDILYPAQFGFFPYRTSVYRGNVLHVCLVVFGAFAVLAGALAAYLSGVAALVRAALRHSPPSAIGRALLAQATPLHCVSLALLFVGCACVLTALCAYCHALHPCSEHRRHHHRHARPPRYTTVHLAAPPPYPILTNRHTQPAIFNEHDEMKLFPSAHRSQSVLLDDRRISMP